MAKMTLDDLVTQLRAAYGEELLSIVLYGSAAGGERSTKKSDQNVLVVLRRIDVSRLKAAAAATRAWGDAGNPPPLIFTDAEWRGSADIFPMEYADILERNRVLHGQPPFDGITVDPPHLRLQLEQEAMSKLLRLRQAVLASGGDGKQMLELLVSSISPVMVIYRSLLRLVGQRPPTDNVALVDEAARIAGFDPGPLERAVRHARGAERIPPAQALEVVGGYIAGVERLVRYLDEHRPGAAPA